MLGTGVGGNVMTGTCGAGSHPALGVVLRIPLHMALCCGRTWIEVLIYKFDADVRAPFEKPPFSSFEKGGSLGCTTIGAQL